MPVELVTRCAVSWTPVVVPVTSNDTVKLTALVSTIATVISVGGEYGGCVGLLGITGPTVKSPPGTVKQPALERVSCITASRCGRGGSPVWGGGGSAIVCTKVGTA